MYEHMFASSLSGMEPAQVSTLDPLGEASAAHELGLLATRGLAAVRRFSAGQEFDAIDLGSLSKISGELESSGHIVQFLTSGGQQGHGPDRAAASNFGVTVDAVVSSGRVAPDASLEQAFHAVATEIIDFATAPTQEVADLLATFFALLIRAAANQTAAIGETVVAL
jgi:hypothetical protein